MRPHTRTLLAATLCLLVALAAPAATPAPAFEWNVFLSPWQLIGPFPKVDDDPGGLDTDYLGGEAGFTEPSDVTYEGTTYHWRAYDKSTIDIEKFFDPSESTDNVVGYALTRFTSDREQDAILAVGSDDGFRAWLNGEKVLEYTAPQPAQLDHTRGKVHLRKGVNTCLLKVEDQAGAWYAMARLLPADIPEPLLTFEWTGIMKWSDFSLPDLSIDFVDEEGKVIVSHRTSGHRSMRYDHPVSLLYAPEPEAEPAAVRISYLPPGGKQIVRTVSWERAHNGPVLLDSHIDVRLSGVVVEAETGDPIEGAQIVCFGEAVPGATDEKGRFEIERVNLAASRVAAVAPGYEVGEVRLDVSSPAPLLIELRKGGGQIKGEVVNRKGEPVEGATVSARTSGILLSTVTDAAGHFLLPGVGPDESRVTLEIMHPDHVPLDEVLMGDGGRFPERTYALAAGVVAQGRVTDKADGRPLGGVRIMATTDQGRRRGWVEDREAVTDENGRYRLTGVPASGALVHAFRMGYVPASQRVPADISAGVDFGLEHGSDVTGRVIDPEGKPIAGVVIDVYQWGRHAVFPREVYSDQDGRFLLRSMPLTPTPVYIWRKGYRFFENLDVIGGSDYTIVFGEDSEGPL